MREELIEEGTVIESENGFVDIQLVTNESCDECSAKIFCKATEDSSRILKIADVHEIQKGDKVTISIPGKTLLGAVVNLYLYPLILFITIILLGLKLLESLHLVEFYSFIIGCFFTSLYYFIFFKFGIDSNIKAPIIRKL